MKASQKIQSQDIRFPTEVRTEYLPNPSLQARLVLKRSERSAEI